MKAKSRFIDLILEVLSLFVWPLDITIIKTHKFDLFFLRIGKSELQSFLHALKANYE
jgi:hypothetical protein